MKKYLLPIFACLALISCKDEDSNDDNGYSVPSTYSFENVSYSGQTNRLDMLEELTTYVKMGATQGTSIDAQKMKDMFKNSNSPFADADLNASTKQLQNKCFVLDTADFIAMFDSLELIGGVVGGANGKAGIVTNGVDSYLCDSKGFEYAQLIDKGLMGAIFYYQAMESYLTDAKIGDAVDNTTVTPGEGTDREHHFDEAFGYFGVPTDFPTNTTDVRFWGKYCNGRDGMLATNQKIMDAWLKGRAAISNNDKSATDAAVTEIRKQWELVCVGTALHYLNGGIDNIADDAKRNHELTEAVAFVKSLQYSSTKVITNSEITDILNAIGDNLYEVTVQDINNAKTILADIYGLGTAKDQF